MNSFHSVHAVVVSSKGHRWLAQIVALFTQPETLSAPAEQLTASPPDLLMNLDQSAALEVHQKGSIFQVHFE